LLKLHISWMQWKQFMLKNAFFYRVCDPSVKQWKINSFKELCNCWDDVKIACFTKMPFSFSFSRGDQKNPLIIDSSTTVIAEIIFSIEVLSTMITWHENRYFWEILHEVFHDLDYNFVQPKKGKDIHCVCLGVSMI